MALLNYIKFKFGFCKIPFALVKRYASELNQDIESVSKCMESERLSQLEKLGKLGVSLMKFFFQIFRIKFN